MKHVIASEILAGLVLFLVLVSAGQAAERKVKVFIVAGQSNMAGRGQVEPQDTEPDPRVFVLDKAGQWQPAAEP